MPAVVDSPYDPQAGTLYGKRLELEDFDVEAFRDFDTVVVLGGKLLEVGEDKVDGFKQVGRQLFICPKDDSNTLVLKVCWCCKWLAKVHRPDCPWKAVTDVSDY
jgi:hypothetical protein